MHLRIRPAALLALVAVLIATSGFLATRRVEVTAVAGADETTTLPSTTTAAPTTTAPATTITTADTAPPSTAPPVTEPPVTAPPTTINPLWTMSAAQREAFTAYLAPRPAPTLPPVTLPPATLPPVVQTAAPEPAPESEPAPEVPADPPPAAEEPAPEPPPADQANPLDALSPSDQAFLDCVRWRESRGDYGAVNRWSGAGGAYQFLQSTWNNTASHVGRWDLVGIHPSQAAPIDQDAMAVALLQWYGRSPWGGYC